MFEHVHFEIMDEFEIMMRIDAVMRDQPGERRAFLMEEFLLERARGGPVEPQQIGDISRDPRVHLSGDIGSRGVERVVEIEDPVPDRGQAREHGHGPKRRGGWGQAGGGARFRHSRIECSIKWNFLCCPRQWPPAMVYAFWP